MIIIIFKLKIIFYFFFQAETDYSCDPTCNGCWSTGPKSCQFCKTYKLEDQCVEDCKGTQINNVYAYLADTEKRECKFCHPECKLGCNGTVFIY